jgi:hypothetical protein
MARRKRTSPSIEAAKARSNGLKSIDEALDLGNNLTLAAFDAAISDVEKDLNDYNQLLSDLDAALNRLNQSEAALDTLSSRMLSATGVKFGKDSTEYEQAGGTRTSERKAPARKAKKTPEPVIA